MDKRSIDEAKSRLPHERTVGSHPLALRQGIAEGIETTQTEEDIDNLVQNLPLLELDEAEDEDHAESTRQVPGLEPEGDGVNETPHEIAVSTDGQRIPIATLLSSDSGISQSSAKVFNRLVRAHRNAASALNTRFRVAAALHDASKSSSLTENELEKIELTVKALLAKLIRYRRIVTTSVGSIGMAHPQVHKNDKICYFQGSESTLIILREESLSPDKLLRMAAQTGKSSSDRVASTDENQTYKTFRVIGEATLAGFLNPEFFPQGLKWELFALI